jgi:hypothetical protein
MIRLGLRLTLNGGREAAVRLAVTAAAVALGAGLLLITLACINAINAQNARAAWLGTGSVAAPGGPPAAAAGTGRPAPAAAWWLTSTDQFAGQSIYRVDVAATGPGAPVPPGIPHLPGPGQFYASPALSRLLRATPPAELGDRYPGHQIGTIGPSALPAPNSLIIVIGRQPGQLARAAAAVEVTRIQTVPGSGNGPGLSPAELSWVLGIAALALLLPVLILIGTATRLAAARREQRFAAMRLVGATPRQVSVIAAVESCCAAAAGAAAGLGLFFLTRPALLHVPVTGQPFAAGDLSLSPPDVLLVVLGVPAASAGAARLALRRVQISPLGVSRRVTPPAPRAWRVIPLLAGIAELACFVAAGRPGGSNAQLLAYLSGFLLIMAGLLIAGPWLTMTGARIMVRRASRPATLVAARRLSDNPQAAFRAISGLILALFVATVSVGVITASVDAQRPSSGTAASNTLVDHFYAVTLTRAIGSVPAIPGAVPAKLRAIRGVRGVTMIYTDPLTNSGTGPRPYRMTGLVSCAQLSRTPAIGQCAPRAAVAAIEVDLGVEVVGQHQAAQASPAAGVSAGHLERLPIQAVVVATDGSTAAIEQSRTVLQAASPYLGSPTTIGQADPAARRTITDLEHLADVVIAASLVIAGCSLAVGVAGGLTDRKRPFSLLRLAGVPLGVLRRVVLFESVIPLVVTAAVSAAAGFLAAALFLRSELSLSLQAPGAGYYAITAAGVAAGLAVITATLPLLQRITGPETARNE